MRIIQKSVLTEAPKGNSMAINEILKYSRSRLQSHFNVALGSNDETLRNSYTVIYWNSKHKVRFGDTGTSYKVSDSAVTSSPSSLVNRLNDAADDDIFLFLLWKDNCTFNNKTYSFVTNSAKGGCPSGVILASYVRNKLDNTTNLGCIWNEHTEDGKSKRVFVTDTYKETNLIKIAQDCSVVIKLKSNSRDKAGNTVTVKNYLLDKYVKGFNEMLLYAGEVKKNLTNDFKVIYENAQKAFDEIDKQYKTKSAVLSDKERKAYEDQLNTVNDIIDSLEQCYLALNSDRSATVPREHNYDEGLITEATDISKNKFRRKRAEAIMDRVKNSNNYEASGTTAAAKKQDETNVLQKINQVKAKTKQTKDETEKFVLQTNALIDLPEFITKCVKTWKRINLYYNREATIRTVASNDPSILLEYENIFNQFPSETLYASEQKLEALYNELYTPNGIMKQLRELYKKSKSNELKFIYVELNGEKKELNAIKLDDETTLAEISLVLNDALNDYLKKIANLDELKRVSVSLKELTKNYFETGPLSNEYFEAHNKILKDIEERIAKRVGTTATVKSVDATNVSVHNQ